MDGNSKPILTEPGVKYFLGETLKQCHQFKEHYYNILINLAFFFGFVFVLGAILLYKYKGKLTPEQMREKELEKQRFILSRIKNYQDAKIREQQQLITGLPQWENEYDVIHEKIRV
jgi:hypothetical protein